MEADAEDEASLAMAVVPVSLMRLLPPLLSITLPLLLVLLLPLLSPPPLLLLLLLLLVVL